MSSGLNRSNRSLGIGTPSGDVGRGNSFARVRSVTTSNGPSLYGTATTQSRALSHWTSGSFRSSDRTTNTTFTSIGSISQIVHGRSSKKKEFLQRFQGWSSLRLMIYDLIESKWFGGTILGIILMNTVLIALQTDRTLNVNLGWYFSLVDCIFLGVYIVELLLKFYVWRCAFFSNGWNNFDLFIVFMSVAEVVWLVLIGSLSSFNPRIFRLLRLFRAIRAFRALRVLRTISFFQNLQIIVTTLLKSIPAWGTISMLLLLVLYIFAITGVTLYGDIAPQYFGTIYVASFSLFQLITLDDWFDLYDAVREEDSTMILYLIVFIVVETFIFINLFIAVIVNNLEAAQRRNNSKIQHELQKKKKVQERLRKGNAAFDLDHTGPRKNEDVAGLDDRSRDVDHYYDAMTTNSREKQHMGYSLMLLAALENNLDYLQHQRKTLDDLVDIAGTKKEQ